jgi:hypothetical protein
MISRGKIHCHIENSRQWIGIDISPTACRVMAKRLRDVCALPESEPLWRAGRGFVVRDLPWTVESKVGGCLSLAI